jgi:hypothetical protein
MANVAASAPSVEFARPGIKSTGVAVLGVLALVVAPLGATWIHVPANPASHAPAVEMSFNALKAVVVSGKAPTTAIQHAYFGWLCWTLVIVMALLVIAALITSARKVGLALSGSGLATIVLTAFALKGPHSWSVLPDQISSVRIGIYLLLAGCLLIVGLGMRYARNPR